MAEEKKTSLKEEVKKRIEESKSAIQKTSGNKKSTEAKVELEREYIVPLKKESIKAPRYRRAKKAVRVLKEFIAQHMKVRDRDLRKIKLDINLNNELWFRGIKKPASKIKVKARKVGEFVYVELAEVPKVVEYKIKRLNKRKAAKVKQEVKPTEKDNDDKDNDGVSDKVEVKEDIKSEAIMGAKLAENATKAEKHSTHATHQKNAKPMMKQPKK